MNNILLIDNTSKILNTITNKINYTLQQQKQKLAYKIFDKNEYIQNYIKNFYDNITDSFFEDDSLCRFTPFDFSQIPDNLKEDFKTYMSDYHGLYYHNGYDEGFTVSSFDNIYISYDKEIFANFTKKAVKLTPDYNNLELFLKLEKIQAENDIYPDIVYLDYYGQFKNDYKRPEEYKFFKTAMHKKEDRLLYFINTLIEIFDNSENMSLSDNFIIDNFTPDFLFKINDNIGIDITKVKLDDNFNLTITYQIPTKLQPEAFKKLNITNFYINEYNETVITIQTNIKEWLITELNRGYSFDELKRGSQMTDNQFINTLNDLIGDIHIRIDAKQMIAELRACQNNYVYLDINSKNLTQITIRDNFRSCTIKTKN